MADRETKTRREALSFAATASAALVASGCAMQGAQAQTPQPPTTNDSLPYGPVTPILARYIAQSRMMAISDQHRDLARQHVLDTLASVVACRDLEPSVLARKYALMQSGTESRNAATILGTSDRASLMDAVFAGAMTGHGAEINDFIPSAYVQPGPSIVAAALGLAETRGLSRAELMDRLALPVNADGTRNNTFALVLVPLEP